ncbi:GGDEF domain-containing protein [Demequina capsici]|uniref:GGDEF domain-containing protein n=1 Tax=Demequina capsici TaxID=3075620 RepID=A0AA96FFJ4_9MICO|nr:GGDEF domain-containing protein [Demequina sp. PMTSA13]WNM28802.1 GGDEF domain-containing protein [Demequina sp. PMTSA13]
MLDLDTLRTAQAAVGVCAFALVYLGTYRPTRAPYAAWWSAAVVASGLGTAIYLVAGGLGRLSDALGNAVSVVGAALVWCAARSLHRGRITWWHLVPVPVVVLVWSLLDVRSDGVLSGTLALLLGMGLFLGLTAMDLVRVLKQRFLARSEDAFHSARAAVVSMVIASAATSGFYALRVVSYLVVGPSDPFYVTWTGPLATTLVILIMLVVVTYSVTELSHMEMSRQWREKATHDDLTGLLTRAAFHELAESALLEAATTHRALVMIAADFDHFKLLNDTYGHAEGDRALSAFGDACRGVLREQDLACRMGGEEFSILLVGAGVEDARAVCERLSQVFARGYADRPLHPPTVSWGVTVADPAKPLGSLMARADAALYRAKDAGRDRIELDPTST